jgi:trypsin
MKLTKLKVFLVFTIFIQFGYCDRRIVGGERFEIEDVPFLVSLRIRGNHACGGALITSTFVLTAGHCVFDVRIVSNIRVRVGSTTRHEGGRLFEVLKLHRHPQYDNDLNDFDFAILELAKVVEFSDVVSPIKIVKTSEELQEGDITLVSGWGDTKSDLENHDYLRAVSVPIVANETCRKIYGLRITDRMMCAGFMEGGEKDFYFKIY